MKKDYSRKNYVFRLTIVTLFIIGFLIIISTNNKTYTNITYDISNNRSVKAMHLVSKYILNNIQNKNVTTIEEIITYKNANNVTYNGITSGYVFSKEQPITKCPPYQNKANGNIFYQDYQFGMTRIIEADSRIPCGSIIKISKINNYSDFYAIVLDHSSINLGTKLNLLFESNEVANSFEETTSTYTIVRWGW